MRQSDQKRRIYHCNLTLLPNDAVFNSEFADDKLKLAIRTRTLQGMTPEEFESAYKQVLYGITAETTEKEILKPIKVSSLVKPDRWATKKRPIPSRDEVDTILAETIRAIDQDEIKDEPNTPQKEEVQIPLPAQKAEPIPAPVTTTALVTTTEESLFDLVPTSIDQLTIAKSGHAEDYLLRVCQKYQITRRQLHEMLECKKEYKTNFPTMLTLLDKDYDIEQIQMFLEAREQIVSDEKEFNLSLKLLVRFHERFEGLPLDADHLACTILETFQEMAIHHIHADYDYYIGTAIKNIIEIADELDTPFLEVAIDWLNQKISNASFY